MLSWDWPVRARLVRLGPEDHVLLVTTHHIASDGWSIGVVMRELASLYAGRPLSALPIRYRDYAAWQRGWLAGERRERQLSYWRTRLSDLPPLLLLPTDRPRPAVQRYRGRQTVPSGCRGNGGSAASRPPSGRHPVHDDAGGLRGGVGALRGASDLAIGTPVANRGRLELEGLIGFLVNTLAMRVDLSGNPSVRDLLGRIRRGALEAYEHQDLPFEEVVEALHPERSLAHAPLFQVMFALQNAPVVHLGLAGLEIDFIDHEFDTTIFDLSLMAIERGEEIEAALQYNTDLFDASTIERSDWASGDAVARHGQCPGRTHRPAPDAHRSGKLGGGFVEPDRAGLSARGSVHRLFEGVAARLPDAVAVEDGAAALSYRELDAWADGLAGGLRGPGLLRDACRPVRFALGWPRGGDAGHPQAGCCYVPLDPAYPAERLEFMSRDACWGR